ncbi:MAG TPA: hypothetical protein VK467_04540 [Gemmatimonadales bacterium]|nr:hypothetical protein [Gemmatimonadales bacterium]
MSLLGILIMFLIMCVVIWGVRALMAAFSIGDPIATVVYVFLVIIFLVWLLQGLGGVSLGTVRL